MPPLETERLLIRPFAMEDLDSVHRILDIELGEADMGNAGAQALDGRERWLRWSVASYEQLALLYQPPYGDRAIVLRATGEVIGACGYVPCLNAFGQIPALATAGHAETGFNSTEFGLYWAVSPRHQGQGYATEAARALVAHAFEALKLRRIVATTSHDNLASTRVMEHLGMDIERNPSSEPPWLQVVGVLYNPLLERSL